jgi:magnesium-transporting ATPase (P-type)
MTYAQMIFLAALAYVAIVAVIGHYRSRKSIFAELDTFAFALFVGVVPVALAFCIAWTWVHLGHVK